jgi:WD40 repeat protein
MEICLVGHLKTNQNGCTNVNIEKYFSIDCIIKKIFLIFCQGIYDKESYTFCTFNLSFNKKHVYVPSSESGVIDLIDLESRTKLNSLVPSSNSKKGMLMSMKTVNENQLMAGYESGELVLFDARMFKDVSCVDLFRGQPLTCFDYFEKNNFGVCGSSENEIKEFSIANHNLREAGSITITNPGLNIIKIRNSDSKIFATGGWDFRVRIFSVKKPRLLAVLDFHKDAINTIDFSEQNLVAVGSNDGIISFWNLYN